jgi:glycosyltransferase involved in cell wall biosynthesis
MKIFHVIENIDVSYGGPARSVPNLISSLKSCGIEGTIVTVRWLQDEYNEILDREGLECEKFSKIGPSKVNFSIGLLKYLFTIAREKNVAIHLHSIWNFTALSAYLASKIYGIPLIISPRGSLYPWSLSQGKIRKTIAWHLFMKNALNHCSFIHVTDKSELCAVKDLGIKADCKIIPNAVEQNSILYQRNLFAQRIERVSDGVRTYLFLSRIHKKKGVEELIRAWKLSGIGDSGTFLRIVGPCEDKAYLSAMIRLSEVLGVSSSIKFVGLVKGRQRQIEFESADVFILPSHTENYGIAIAEALSFGLPVITTVNTPWSSISSTNSGWYIDLSVLSISNALKLSSTLSPIEYKIMSNNAYKLSKNHDWDKRAEDFSACYNEFV